MVVALTLAVLIHLQLMSLVYLGGLASAATWVTAWLGLAIIATIPLAIFLHQIKKGVMPKRPGLAIFFAANLFFICIEPALSGLLGLDFPSVSDFGKPTDAHALLTALIVSLGFAAFFLGYGGIGFALSAHGRPSGASRRAATGNGRVTLLALSLFIVGLIGVFLLQGGLSSVIDSFSSVTTFLLAGRQFGVMGSTRSFGLESPLGILFFSALIPAAVLAITSALKRHNADVLIGRPIMIAIALASLSLVAVTGGRTGLAMIFGSVVLLATYDLLHRIQEQPAAAGAHKVRLYLLYIMTIVGMLAITALQINFRTVGWSNIDVQSIGAVRISDAISGYSLNQELAFIVQHELNYLSESNTLFERIVLPIPDTIMNFIISFIPRSFWHNKPIDPTWIFYNYIRTGSSGLYGGTNITPTYLGRFYMKYGMVGVFEIGLMFGIAWRITEHNFLKAVGRNPANAALYALIAMFLFQATRDVQPGRIYPAAMLAVAIIGFKVLSRSIPARRGAYRR